MMEMACRIVMPMYLMPGLAQTAMGLGMAITMMVAQTHDWIVLKIFCSSW